MCSCYLCVICTPVITTPTPAVISDASSNAAIAHSLRTLTQDADAQTHPARFAVPQLTPILLLPSKWHLGRPQSSLFLDDFHTIGGMSSPKPSSSTSISSASRLGGPSMCLRIRMDLSSRLRSGSFGHLLFSRLFDFCEPPLNPFNLNTAVSVPKKLMSSMLTHALAPFQPSI